MARALLIVVYFFVTTVWLPDRLTHFGTATTGRDLAVVAVWGTGLVAGMWLLRWAQRRGWI
jgi:hypothetical protein